MVKFIFPAFAFWSDFKCLFFVLLQDHAHLLDNPPQPEAVNMQEVDDEVPILAAPVVEEGAGQSLGGEATGHLD